MAKNKLTQASVKALRMLVVENNKFMRSIIMDQLRQMGCDEIKGAENGLEAIEMMAFWTPDVIFSDWDMPMMDGIELTQWLRRDPGSPNQEIPIIFITGRTQPSEVVQARNAGITEFIAKPVTAAHVEHRLCSVLFEPREFMRCKKYIGPCRRRRWANDHKGELRRDSDTGQPYNAKKMSVHNNSKIKIGMAALAKMAPELDITDPKQFKAVVKHIESVRLGAEESDDSELVEVAVSLATYVAACANKSATLEREVVFMHLSTLSHLIDTCGGEDEARQNVVAGLKAVVRKLLRDKSEPPTPAWTTSTPDSRRAATR